VYLYCLTGLLVGLKPELDFIALAIYPTIVSYFTFFELLKVPSMKLPLSLFDGDLTSTSGLS